MADPFAAATAAIFATAVAVPATYTPPAGAPVSVPVILRRPDATLTPGGVGFSAPSVVIDVEAARVAQPVAGGTFAVNGVVYTIQAPPQRDALRLVWSCPCLEPSA